MNLCKLVRVVQLYLKITLREKKIDTYLLFQLFFNSFTFVLQLHIEIIPT